MAHNSFKLTKTERLPDSEALVTGEINLPFLVECRAEAVKYLNEKADIPGFRKGKVPENVLVKELGEMRILEESAEIALSKAYSEIMAEAKLSPIGRPQISITKMAPGVPLEFKIQVPLEPEFTLPDYKKIAASVEKEDVSTNVSDEEVAGFIEELKKRNIKPELKEGEKLEDKIKENLSLEKSMQARDRRRIKIMEDLVKETNISAPKALIEEELERMLAQFRDDVTRMGMDWNEYLKKAEKTEADIKNDWKDKALERVKAELIIAKLAETEKIEPDMHDVEHETEHLLHHYPDADPLRARIYIYSQLRTQKVLEFLENADGPKKEAKKEKEEKPKKETKPKGNKEDKKK